MDRKKLLDLMQFVCDQNKVAFFELIKAEKIDLLSVLESKTKDSFFKMIERM
jgi:hypothetical protein